MTISRVRELLGKKLAIPTLPDTALRVQQMVDDPEVGTKEIGALVAQDAPLATRVLRVANSAFYGLSGRCISVEHASTVLGTGTLRNIVTQVAVTEAFKHLEDIFDLSKIWEHAILTAKMSSHLADIVMYRAMLDTREFYTCGLLHDIGKVVMLDAFGERYLEILEEAGEGGSYATQTEEREFGFDHAEVGGYVATQWNLPDVVRETALHHHGPLDKVANDPAVAIVYAANRLVNQAPSSSAEQLLAILEDPAVETLGMERSEGVVDFALKLVSSDDPTACWLNDL